jgi:hypothetical protein
LKFPLPDATLDNPVSEFMQNPFNIDVDSLPDPLQEQVVKLKRYSSGKVNFETMSLEEFWVKYLPTYPKVGEESATFDHSLFFYLAL